MSELGIKFTLAILVLLFAAIFGSRMFMHGDLCPAFHRSGR